VRGAIDLDIHLFGRRRFDFGTSKDFPDSDIAAWRWRKAILGPLAPVRPKTEIRADRRDRVF
jgi:hypothetical protein